MIKKAILAAGISLLCLAPVFAEEPATLSDRIDRVDEVIYGSAQSGSLISRVDNADNLIYGNGNSSASGLDNRITNLYTDVVKSDNDAQPSIATRVNAMEYYLTDEIRSDSLKTRMGDLETKVYGAEKKGAIDQRLANLEKSVYGDQHYEMKTVELPADTVFKISLNDDVSSKTNQVGDPVTFTVQEDVSVGNVLVLPKGAQGSGVVTKVSRPKSFGRSGALDISFDQVFSVDDEVIPTVLGPEAKEKLKMEAAAVGASTIGALALGPIGLVGGFFVKGKDVSLPAGSTLYIETQEAVTTKGLELTSGAPNAVIRKRVVRSAAADTETAKAAADNEVKETETAASAPVAKAEEKAEAKVEAKANDTSTAMNEKAKAELESVREKDTETAKTGSSAEEAPSVVIVRNE
ncbi:hypothetical protein [uncultured Dialister sp.]|jgi:hypothetical protein|uniref:hypothetical protein n=1 Tax=uncultured Dialister sp. TaxID=278064 RepID=UPI0025FD20A0|nr:hypothetical protein [uncultured Dialister sp.]